MLNIIQIYLVGAFIVFVVAWNQLIEDEKNYHSLGYKIKMKPLGPALASGILWPIIIPIVLRDCITYKDENESTSK